MFLFDTIGYTQSPLKPSTIPLNPPHSTLPITHSPSTQLAQTPISNSGSHHFYYTHTPLSHLQDTINTQNNPTYTPTPTPTKSQSRCSPLSSIDFSKKLSMTSTTDFEGSVSNESALDSPDDSPRSFKQNSEEFSFGHFGSLSLCNQSSLKFQEAMSSKIGRVPDIVLKRQRCQYLEDSIKRLREQESIMFQSIEQIKVIKAAIQFLVSNLGSLQGLDYLDMLNCLNFIGLPLVPEVIDSLKLFIESVSLRIGKEKIPVTISMRALFDLLDWDFQPFSLYFWLQARLKALHNEMFYQRPFPFPGFNQFGLQKDIQQTKQTGNLLILNLLQTLENPQLLEKYQSHQILTAINSLPDDPHQLTKRSLTFSLLTSVPQNSSSVIPSPPQPPIGTRMTFGKQLSNDIYQVRMNVGPRDLCFQFQVCSGQNVEEIIKDLGTDYNLDGEICQQMARELSKSLEQLMRK